MAGHDAPSESGSVDHGLHGGGVAVTLHVDTVGRLGQLVDVVLTQVELGGSEVFVESFEASSAGDGHDPRLSRQQPCQGDLSWGGVQAGSDRGDFVDELEVAGQGFGGEPGKGGPDVASAEGGVAGVQVLVIQGVAGSGKTAMALHRVAYLLYPGNQLAIDPQRCIVFGPNQLFLGYVANVLPGLGVADIPQTTLDAWALDRLGLTGRPTVDATLEALLDIGRRVSDKRRRMQTTQLKVSVRMGQVLDRLAEWWRGRLNVPVTGLAYDGLGPFKVTARL